MRLLKRAEIKSYKKLGVGSGLPMYKSMRGLGNLTGKMAAAGARRMPGKNGKK